MEMEVKGSGNSGGSGSAYVTWSDLTVVVGNTVGKGNSSTHTRRVLSGLNGYAQPGRIMAVMGPSGSGKSTLLDSLAGRLSADVVMTGKILVNGKKQRLVDYGGVAYVGQENTLLGTLTVRETITYSANLRLPPSLNKDEIQGIVDETIDDMGLQDCSNRLIGNWHLRGISGGEKKRLSIALEILTRPKILLLDEPTSGLDSAASYFVVQILKSIAWDQRTVVSSIHQPSSETFAQFDDLFLLSGGEAVYFGEAKKAIEFFAESGFPCPSRRSPSDHFLRCINSNFDKARAMSEDFYGRRQLEKISDPLSNMETEEIKSTLVDKYKWSEYARMARTRMQEISSMPASEVEFIRPNQATWWKQLSTLTKRSFVNMSRDFGYHWARIVVFVLLSISLGTIWYDVGTSFFAIYARGTCGGFVMGALMTMSIGGFPSFIEEMKVFTKERQNGYYGVGVYCVSNCISSFPYLVAMAVPTCSISFYMVKFRKEFSHFIYYFLNFFGCIAAIEAFVMVVASIVPNYWMGIVTSLGMIGVMVLTCGFFRNITDLPKVFWRYPISYISFQTWAAQGFLKNDLLGLEFDPLIPGDPKLKGSVLLPTMYGIPPDGSKWKDLAAVYIIVICYRIIFFLVLKFTERATPFFRMLYTKKIVNRLKKRPSFRKLAFPSKRLQPSHPLNEQDGLSSPLQ